MEEGCTDRRRKKHEASSYFGIFICIKIHILIYVYMYIYIYLFAHAVDTGGNYKFILLFNFCVLMVVFYLWCCGEVR